MYRKMCIPYHSTVIAVSTTVKKIKPTKYPKRKHVHTLAENATHTNKLMTPESRMKEN